MRILSVAADLLILNLLATVGVMLIVPAGASVAALHDVAGQMVRGEESYIIRSFFRSFRSNFREATKVGLLFLAAAVLLVVELWGVGRFYGGVLPIMVMVLFAGSFFIAVTTYAFALLVRCRTSLLCLLKDALLLTVGYLPRTAAIVAVWFLWLGLFLRFGWIVLPVGLMFGLSVPIYLIAWIYDSVVKSQPTP